LSEKWEKTSARKPRKSPVSLYSRIEFLQGTQAKSPHPKTVFRWGKGLNQNRSTAACEYKPAGGEGECMTSKFRETVGETGKGKPTTNVTQAENLQWAQKSHRATKKLLYFHRKNPRPKETRRFQKPQASSGGNKHAQKWGKGVEHV